MIKGVDGPQAAPPPNTGCPHYQLLD